MLGGGGKLTELFRCQFCKPGGKIVQLVDVVKITYFVGNSPDAGTALQDNNFLIPKAIHPNLPQSRLNLFRGGGEGQEGFV